MVAYCVQCKTHKCRAIGKALESKGAVRAFSPQVITRQRTDGKTEERAYDMLPGYVFMYLEEPLNGHEMFSGISGIIRWLGESVGNGSLTGSDYDFAMYLYQMDGTFRAVTIIKEGDIIRLTDPLFEGYQGEVIRIDHRKQRAKIRFLFDRQVCMTWVACDVIYKDKSNQTWSA